MIRNLNKTNLTLLWFQCLIFKFKVLREKHKCFYDIWSKFFLLLRSQPSSSIFLQMELKISKNLKSSKKSTTLVKMIKIFFETFVLKFLSQYMNVEILVIWWKQKKWSHISCFHLILSYEMLLKNPLFKAFW